MEGVYKVTDMKDANKTFVMQIHGKSPSDEVLLKVIFDKGNIRMLTKRRSGSSWKDHEPSNSKIWVGYNKDVRTKITVNGSGLQVFVNGSRRMHISMSELRKSWSSNNTFYFKAGNYLQHNNKKFGNRGKVMYKSLYVWH